MVLRGSEGAPDKKENACWLTVGELSFEDNGITEITIAGFWGQSLC